MISQKAKARNNIVISILVGVCLITGGIFFLTRTDVACGTGQVMRPGDICEETRKGKTTSYTFEERQDYWQRMGWIAGGVGLVLIGYGGWMIVRRRRASATTEVAA